MLLNVLRAFVLTSIHIFSSQEESSRNYVRVYIWYMIWNSIKIFFKIKNDF